MRYLLDTTLIADHANGFEPAMALLARLYEDGGDLFTCDVVTCEALSGGTDEHLRAVAHLLGPLEYVATSPEAARPPPCPTRSPTTGGRSPDRCCP